MQSGPISSTVCGKWHVPPEEAQKQLQPAINYTPPWASVCLWRQNHAWGLMSLLASLKGEKKKNSTQVVRTWSVRLSRKLFLRPLRHFSHQHIAVKLAANTTGSGSQVHAALIRCNSEGVRVSFCWNPSRPGSWPFLESEDLFLIPQKKLWCWLDSTSGFRLQ